MIPKHKAPHLNRAQRRHPEKLTMQQLPKGEAMPWLLYGLLRKGGYMAGINLADYAGTYGGYLPDPPKGFEAILAKARRFFNRIIGR